MDDLKNTSFLWSIVSSCTCVLWSTLSITTFFSCAFTMTFNWFLIVTLTNNYTFIELQLNKHETSGIFIVIYKTVFILGITKIISLLSCKRQYIKLFTFKKTLSKYCKYLYEKKFVHIFSCCFHKGRHLFPSFCACEQFHGRFY